MKFKKNGTFDIASTKKYEKVNFGFTYLKKIYKKLNFDFCYFCLTIFISFIIYSC